MKNKIFKTLAVFGLSLLAWNCSEDLATAAQNGMEAITPQAKPALEVDQSSWMLVAGSQIFLIVPNGTGTYLVTNEASIPVGAFNVATGSIVDMSGNPVVNNINLATLPVVSPDKTITYPDGSKATITGQTLLLPGGIDPNSIGTGTGTNTVSSSSVYIPTQNPVASSSSAKNNQQQPKSSSSQKVDQPKPASSSSQQQPKSSATSNQQCNGQCFDSASGKCVGYHDQQTGSKGEKYAYDESCKLNCYYDPNNQNCQGMTGAGPTSSTSQPKSSNSVKSSSSQQQPKSSSSQPKSSSSAPKSSSSQAQNNPNASAEEAQYLNAGAGGQQGFATRYWDCCMPHCAWPEHGGAAKTCDAKGKTPIGNTSGSICSGGQGTTCTSQIPIIVSDKLAYAFAATPGNDATCGKCFALTFTGTGKYETKANHQALKGKTLVVMASNIGYDVQGGQFDIMIPGGGFGAFNGCSQMGWNIPQNTTTYGGLLSDCEKEVGYNGNLLTLRKECLTKKCNSAFANDAEAKEGCLFLATWMEAAGNPNHTYKEVPCPQALKSKF
jgi:hypothetical protein